jgi:N6-L-threonylcarbamoyladenine synthase
VTLVLGIETSCDETAASIVRDGAEVLSNIVATQHDLHEEYGGVVPELASRAHLERITPVLRSALREAGVSLQDLDAIAVGNRPGLIGSLVVGVAAAKALAWSIGKPLIGVDHVHAHLYAVLLGNPSEPVEYPALGLVASGGHTTMYRVDSPTDFARLGSTIDDAVGEAFDKCAAMLGLGHPGGPLVDTLAQRGDDRAHDFPISRIAPDSLDFSFSGLKTSVLYTVRGQPSKNSQGKTVFPRTHHDLDDAQRADLAASFQRAAVSAVILKLDRAISAAGPFKSIVIGGGVSANSRLRAEVSRLGAKRGLPVHLPAMAYCVDNAAMIAGLGTHRLRAGMIADLSLAAVPTTAC